MKSQILCLAIYSDVLYAGGILTGKAQGQDVTGVYAYNMSGQDFSTHQPPALKGRMVLVNTMRLRPNSDQLYIGGSLGSVESPGVCVYDIASKSWSRPGTKLNGNVSYLTWTDEDTLIAGGKITVGGTSYSLATYYVPDGEWAPFREDQPIPGPLSAISPTDSEDRKKSNDSTGWSSDSTGFWIAGNHLNGSAFLMKWSNGTWLVVDQYFGNSSVITGVEVMTLDQATAPNKYLENGRILILTGSLDLNPTGKASAAFFNGTHVWPMLLTIAADGHSGMVTGMFSEQKSYFPTSPPDGKGTVVAVAVAILAVLLSIIIIGELGEICRRCWIRRKSYTPITQRERN